MAIGTIKRQSYIGKTSYKFIGQCIKYIKKDPRPCQGVVPVLDGVGGMPIPPCQIGIFQRGWAHF